MPWISIIIIVGLIVFETVSSVDNAIVNAHMLRTMSERARRWFLLWGLFFAVFLARGILPLLIVWLTAPNVTLLGALRATFGGDDLARQAIEQSSFILLIGGGMFLLLLYLHWLFLEKKEPYFVPDKWVKEHHGVWFFALSAILLVTILYLTRHSPLAMIAAATGNAVFFILYGFRELAEKEEAKLERTGRSDISKFLYLEVLDLSFSIDGIFGAFAFTTNILLIFIGNGIGAFVVRELTIRGINQVAKYRWLKNGAMTSIGFLGVFMILESLGAHIPEWLPTVITCGLVGITFWSSHRHLKKASDSD
ncbi:MAG: hypothetical protein UY92_C0003G0036 [Candidatus Magasanikbacteria bacterium GW2011_GWA2_56_11]|uniref:Integral membrane protein TerC n=1 Tax=Candidatus Magasanikbacteria bacterium GW2011_GWA2_56_11 TaxID=1619044 RepID=A0A0G1YHZ7_9BACT|nr:MAG: hypothetical protein UY92_C0003G0036 [Candidatus Magasanikbacteria bacterium GW2011_GWA2_56_11]